MFLVVCNFDFFCLGLGTNLEFLAPSRNHFKGFLESLPKVPNSQEFVCLFVCSCLDLVTYMYTDIATLKRNVAENVILWSKRTHLSFEAFVSKPSIELKTVVNIRKLNN